MKKKALPRPVSRLLIGLLFLLVPEALRSDIGTNSLWVDASGYPNLDSAVGAVGGRNMTLVVSKETPVPSSVTVPSNVTLQFLRGGVVTVGPGARLSIDGPLSAPPTQIFRAAAGAVSLGTRTAPDVYPEWWGVDGVDDSVAIRKAIAANPGPIRVKLTGHYRCRSTVNIDKDRVFLVGDGMHVTRMFFHPAASGTPLLNFQKPGGALVQCGVRDVGFSGEGNAKKIAIRCVDTSGVVIENIATYPWTGDVSIAVQLRGREYTLIRNASLSADRPISIEGNPNSTIDVDHLSVIDAYLTVSDPTQACVHIDSGVNLTNVVFGGTQAWVAGRYGLYWSDVSGNASSLNLAVRNVRHEQAPRASAASNWTIYVRHNYSLQNLMLENITCSGDSNGFFLRNVHRAELNGCQYTTPGAAPGNIALDVDASCRDLVLLNCLWQDGSVARLGGLQEKMSLPKASGTAPLAPTAFFGTKANNNSDMLSLFGQKHWGTNVRLEPGGSVGLPMTGSNRAGMAFIVARGVGDSAREGGIYLMTGNTAVLLAGTPNMTIGSARNKICWIEGTDPKILNNTAIPIEVMITTISYI